MRNLNKILIYLISACALFSSAYGQSGKPKSNFFDIQKEFYRKYEAESKERKRDKEEGEEDEFTHFKRWECYWQQRINKDGTFPKPSIVYDEWVNYVNTHQEAYLRQAGTSSQWSSMGLTYAAGGYEGIGRTTDIAYHPTDANTMWVGTPAGGLWKTTDGGDTWTTSTDNLPVLGVSSIVVNPLNPNIMYLATGDGDEGSLYGNGDTKSIGVIKSTNGGATWVTTGLTATVNQGVLIRKICMSPTDTASLLAATSDGLYQTTDGGASWNQVQTGVFKDVVYNAVDGNYACAATYGAAGAEIWQTKDGGASWQQVTAFNSFVRIQLAVSPANPALVQAVAASPSGPLGGVYTSTDSGSSFVQTFGGGANILGYNYDGSDLTEGQGGYDLCIAISQTDANLLYVGGINVWKSNNGGVSWNPLTIWTSDSSANPTNLPIMHSDQHYIGFNPLNGVLWMGNDGGVYKGVGNDSIQDKSNGLEISQFYRIATSQLTPNLVLGGLQDNSTKIYQNSNWSMLFSSGDGMEVAFPDTTIAYCAGPMGKIFRLRQIDGIASISDNLPTGTTPGEWITPFVVNKNSKNTIYAGYANLYVSRDAGDTWTVISNGQFANKLTRVVLAPSDSNVIYAATRSNLYFTTNEGATWTDVTNNLPSSAVGFISDIAVSPTAPNTLLLTLSGYASGDKVFASSDNGNNWTNVSGTLPNLPVTCIIYEENSNGSLYIGTDVGAYYKDAAMPDWVPYGLGLPNVIVNDLDIQYSTKKLMAGTFGRGAWEVDLASVDIKTPIKQESPFSVYPNPNEGSFILKGNMLKAGDKASIYNYIGQTMKTITIKGDNELIDMKDLPVGVYFLGLDADNYAHLIKILKNK